MITQAQNPMGKDWITTVQGAKLTGFSVTHVRKLAICGLIVGFKRGRDWWVLYDSLMTYKQEIEALGNKKHNAWRAGQPEGRGRKKTQ